MAEHLIQDTTLTGIADKIRSLLGLTGTMTTDQMQTNLTTEQANITAALAALTEKGVEVPEGANSNALAGLIAAIESGVKVVTGSWAAAANASQITIEHNLGVIPVFGAILKTGNIKTSYGSEYSRFIGMIDTGDNAPSSIYFLSSGMSMNITGIRSAYKNLTESSISYDGTFVAGENYEYIFVG